MKTTDSLEELAEDAAAGRVNTLIILGGNPAYDAPADLELADRLARIPTHDSTWTVRRRNGSALPVAFASRSRIRVLGRCGDRRRRLFASSTDDCSAVRRAFAVDGAGQVVAIRNGSRIRNCPTRICRAAGVATRTLRHSTVGCTMVLHGVHRARFDPKLNPSGGERSARSPADVPTDASRRRPAWRSVFKPTRRSSTDDSRISAGSRKCPIPSRSSLGIMPR